MSYLSLYRKWRPASFGELLGQDHVSETLAHALTENRVSHAYLFAGPRGCGKTSTARILARALNCANGPSANPCGECVSCRQITDGASLDVYEMDAASHTSVEDVREIREKIPFAAVGGSYKVYIIDEAHQLSTPAFQALLKMLEEPPSHVVFVLCTTESHKLPATVVSRCQRFEFRRLSTTQMAQHLADVAGKEGFQTEPKALALIARHAQGSARDALSLLDQAAGTGDGSVTVDVVTQILGEAPEDVLVEIGDAIASGEVLGAFQSVDRMIERGWDPRQLLRQLLEHIRGVFLARRGAESLLDVDEHYRTQLREQASRLTEAQLEWALRVLGETQADVRWSTHPRLTLEVALVRASRLEADPRTVLARLERLERHLLTKPSEAAAHHAPAPASASASAPNRKAPASAPSRSAAPGLASTGGDSLAALWPSFLDAVKSRKRVAYANLKEGWPVAIEDGEMVVGFERPFYADTLKKVELLQVLLEAVQEIFGRKLGLRLEHRPGGAPAPAAPENETGPASSPVDLLVSSLGAQVVEDE